MKTNCCQFMYICCQFMYIFCHFMSAIYVRPITLSFICCRLSTYQINPLYSFKPNFLYRPRCLNIFYSLQKWSKKTQNNPKWKWKFRSVIKIIIDFFVSLKMLRIFLYFLLAQSTSALVYKFKAEKCFASSWNPVFGISQSL